MISTGHRVKDVNERTRTGFCTTCGPGVNVRRHGDGWRCGEQVNDYKRNKRMRDKLATTTLTVTTPCCEAQIVLPPFDDYTMSTHCRLTCACGAPHILFRNREQHPNTPPIDYVTWVRSVQTYDAGELTGEDTPDDSGLALTPAPLATA